MQNTIKLEKIAYYLDYVDHCFCCGKKLKKVYYTNQGPVGINCFLAAIGRPKTSSQSKKSPKLTPEQYESLAEAGIKRLDQCTNEEFIAYFTNDQWSSEKPTQIERSNYRFIIHYGYGRKSQVDLLFCSPNDFPLRHFIGGIPSDMLGDVRGTQAFNNFWRLNRLENYSTIYST
jgi:hypothetical protein